MATKFKKDEVVRVNTVVPSGPVQKIRMTEDGGFYYMISWTDANGVTQTRWFDESELVAE
jgi:uncharacterized protein YodC (DUF2158 family)